VPSLTLCRVFSISSLESGEFSVECSGSGRV